ncbi:MAG: TonB-dependent receptor, partial [Planctomycetaceae bacterium]|nr:TonB-dependent receptor [Planctomycetaceae bacterium]
YRQVENFLINNAFGTATPFLYNNPDAFDLDSKSQEFQLSGAAFDGKADFVVGAFYFNEDGDYLNTQQINLFSQNAGLYTSIDNTSLALFGEVTFRLSDKLQASIGARYTDEEREQQHQVTDNNFGVTFLDTVAQTFGVLDLNTFTYNFTPQVYPTKIDQSSTSPRLSLDYQWNDEVMSYFTYARGFKSGGFNARSTTALQWGPYDDMQVDSFEVGIKSNWADNRVKFNAAVFYEDLTDMQTQVNAVDADAGGGFSTVVQNAAAATITGLEAELVVHMMSGLDISAGFGYVDPEYDEFISFDNLTGALSDISDDRAFEFTPESNYNLTLNYTFPQFSNNGTLNARLDWSGQSKVRFTPKIS